MLQTYDNSVIIGFTISTYNSLEHKNWQLGDDSPTKIDR